MKVFAALLFVGSLSLVAQAELPSGSDYFGAFFCPPPTPIPEDSDVIPECSAACSGPDDCPGESVFCCAITSDCRTCRQGTPSDGARCRTEDGEEVAPLSITLDEEGEECEYCVCVNGKFYCHELEKLEDETCPELPQPTEGSVCNYEDTEIPPMEFTKVGSDEDCEVCICGNGVVFCTECVPDTTTCEYEGEELRLGETVLSNSGCTLCTCAVSGEVECVMQDDCTPVCLYNGEAVAIGDMVPSEDGCNECTCTEDATLACTERECLCENGEEQVYCFRSPCSGARCPAFPSATCTNDFCGGCNTRWELDGEDVTDRCIGEPPSQFELSQNPTCPAAETDTCAEECSDESPCQDTQLCCRGCGSSCRDPINLPSYDIPLICPPLFTSLSDDSQTCDLECQSDSECPEEKICCRSGCSSYCQYGLYRPKPCNDLRQHLAGDDEEPSDQDDEPLPLGQFVPGCHEEGFFNPVQAWEQYSWCVNVVTGKPISSAYTASDGLNLTCPICTHNGRVFYPGQSFNDDCNSCECTETGVGICTRQACLDPCVLPVSPGTCEDSQTLYFFNTESRLCEEFVYSGCGGNANKFSSVYDCLHACKPESVCLLEWDEGESCDDEDRTNPIRDVFYYYDAEEGECTAEPGYRCGGNGNRFQSGFDCLETCDPSNPGPTDGDGNSCWEIQCDIPFCGEGVQPVYHEDFCCPGCPSTDPEEECEDNEFQCRDGSCIPARQECDGLSDCGDDSDESGDRCDPSVLPCDFQCSDDECVPQNENLNYVCDGVMDCANGLDEVDCDDNEYQVPDYEPVVCPDSSNVLGACDVSQCMADTECEDRQMCCLNNCNQRSCTAPRPAVFTNCRGTVQLLSSINASYVPQCDSDGNYQSLQCSGVGENRMCWCVNIISGTPFSHPSNVDTLECRRCEYDGSRYAPGETYDATDDCNTCVCDNEDGSLCTRKRCSGSCVLIDENGEPSTLDHGETEEDHCFSCTCSSGALSCSRIVNCTLAESIRINAEVEMTFTGEVPESEEEQEEQRRGALRSILGMYGESMGLDDSQMDVEIRSGSVIVVVVFKDNEDDSGANITLLVSQVEKDYKDGVLVIRYNNTALVSTGQINVESVSQEEEDDDDNEFLWWYWLIIGLAGAVIVLAVVFAAFMMFACLKKRAASNGQVKVEPNPSYIQWNLKMKKVPLDEKA